MSDNNGVVILACPIYVLCRLVTSVLLHLSYDIIGEGRFGLISLEISRNQVVKCTDQKGKKKSNC